MQILQHWEVLLVEKLLAGGEVVMMMVHGDVRARLFELSLFGPHLLSDGLPKTLLWLGEGPQLN
jgi:hypothetical protein